MRWGWLVLSIAALVASAGTAEACIEIRVPFVSVRVGCGVDVCAPFARVSVGRPALGPPPPVLAAQPAGEPEKLHAPRPADGSPVIQAIRHGDFARSFKPAAGTYEVDFVHPYTCCPVRVCFTLPHGCPKRVSCDRNELKFDYGRCEVEIEFKRDGRVKVDYDD